MNEQSVAGSAYRDITVYGCGAAAAYCRQPGLRYTARAVPASTAARSAAVVRTTA